MEKTIKIKMMGVVIVILITLFVMKSPWVSQRIDKKLNADNTVELISMEQAQKIQENDKIVTKKATIYIMNPRFYKHLNEKMNQLLFSSTDAL